MESLLLGNELWQLIVQSDQVTKAVFLLLLSMSIGCWTLFLWKLLVFQLKKRQLNRVVDDVLRAKTVEDLATITFRHEGSFGGYVVANCLLLARPLVTPRSLGNEQWNFDQEWNFFQDRLFGLQDRLLAAEEVGVPFLSICAAVAPLLGLFGTVWGLVHSFMRINERGMADIVTIAPGIAEALMTTLAGLLVAIPALVLFNWLHLSMRGFEQKMQDLMDSICTLVCSQIIKQGEVHAPCSAQTSSKQQISAL